MKEIKKIQLEEKVIALIAAKFEDYKAKQDLLTMIFEIHKNDEDGSIIASKPFQAYEKQFAKSKVEYDTLMDEISKTYIPDEYKKSNYRFEVQFDDNELIIIED